MFSRAAIISYHFYWNPWQIFLGSMVNLNRKIYDTSIIYKGTARQS